MIGKFLLSFGLTIFMGVIFNQIYMGDINVSIDQIFFTTIILSFSFAIPNLVFLWILTKSQNMKNNEINYPLIAIEVILLYIVYYSIHFLIDHLPSNIRFNKTSTVMGERFIFGFYFELLYSFIIVFLIFWCYKLFKAASENRTKPKPKN